MYQNHFNAPIGSMNSFNAFPNYGASGNAMQNTTPLPSVPSSGNNFNDPSNNGMSTLYIPSYYNYSLYIF